MCSPLGIGSRGSGRGFRLAASLIVPGVAGGVESRGSGRGRRGRLLLSKNLNLNLNLRLKKYVGGVLGGVKGIWQRGQVGGGGGLVYLNQTLRVLLKDH